MKVQKRLGSMTRSPSGSKHLDSRLGILTGFASVTITQAVKSRADQLFVPTSSMKVMGSHSRGTSQEEAEHGACLPPARDQATSQPLCPAFSSHIVSKKHHSFLGLQPHLALQKLKYTLPSTHAPQLVPLLREREIN